MLIVIEVVFVLVTLSGVALWSVPAALVITGLLGVLGAERHSADRRAARQAAEAKGASK